MAVQDYGVVIGQFDHFDRDDAHHFGSFFHGHIFVRFTNGAGSPVIYNCAVDVKYPDGTVQYFVPTNLDRAKFGGVDGLADGFHALPSNDVSGAIDYVRDPLLSIPLGCATVFFAILQLFTHRNYQVWKENVGGSVLNDLEAFLNAGIQRIYVFGSRFQNAAQDPPQGMHDVHMNQGDPAGPFQHLDAIWQDGGVIVERPDGTLAGFFVKFVTQTLSTNDQGLPA
jgi:hypothetical protein